jgi:hypothetical protein
MKELLGLGKSMEDFAKAKYIKREGTPGHYKYFYYLPEGGISSKVKPALQITTKDGYETFIADNYQDSIDKYYEQHREDAARVSAYSGNAYINIRNQLLGREYDSSFMGRFRDDEEGYRKYVNASITAIDAYIKAFPLKTPLVLYRGFNGDPSSFEKDVEFEHTTFGSFSTVKALTQSATKTNIIFQWVASKGAAVAPALRRVQDENGISMGANSEEAEMLMARKTRFRVVDVEKEGESTIVHVEEIHNA